MVKKFSVAMLAPIMLGAFGACKNEPDNIYVTVPPVHLDIEAREVSVLKRTGKDGIGGLNETTTRLWFEVDRGNFNGYQPKNVIFAPVSGESKGISVSPLVFKGTNQEGGYWRVYSADIDSKTPITANGFVSFELITGEGDSSYRANVEVEAFYAEPVVLSVKAQDGSAERGTTKLAVELSRNGVKLFPATSDTDAVKLHYVYVDGKPTKVSPEGVISINNRSISQKSVNVEVKNEDGNNLVDDDGKEDALRNLSKGYGVATQPTTVDISPAVSIITFEKNDGDKDVIGTTKIKAKSSANKPISVFVDNSLWDIPSNASGFPIGIDNKGDAGTKKTKVTIVPDMTDDDSNGYFIQEEVVIVPAVTVERRSFQFESNTVYGFLDPEKTTAPYEYYFITKSPYPADMVSSDKVSLKGETEAGVSAFVKITVTDDAAKDLPNTVKGLVEFFSDIETVYKITFSTTKDPKKTIFVFADPNGYYIPEVSVNL